MQIDLTRRRFLFGLAAVPLVVPAVTHFIVKVPEFIIDRETVDRAIMELVEDLNQDPVFDGGASTIYSALSEAQKRRWAQEVWKQGRDSSFFFGKGQG